MEELWNLVRREVGRAMAMRSQPKVGVVTSYDPKTHAVKVLLQPGTSEEPDGHETGWIPITTGHVGSGFGDMAAPHLGDQVEVGFQEGDPEVPRIIGRLHSDEAQPPELAEGELLRRHKDGAELRQDKDGNIWMRQGGSTVKVAKDGTVEAKVAAGKFAYLGCTAGEASAFVMTVSGPSKNVKAAI